MHHRQKESASEFNSLLLNQESGRVPVPPRKLLADRLITPDSQGLGGEDVGERKMDHQTWGELQSRKRNHRGTI